MTEDIWAEKPRRRLHKEARYRGGRPIDDPKVCDPQNLANYFYDTHDMDAWLEELKAESDRFKEKAERWDQYAIYDNDKEGEILVKDLITAYEKLKIITTLCQATLDKKLGGLITQVGEKILADKIMKILEADG